MIKYLGSKRLLAPLIGQVAAALPARTAADLFAGTTRVGQELRRCGLEVLSNDTASYSEQLGIAYLEADERLDRTRLRGVLDRLGRLPGVRGYVTETFCETARYLHPENGMRIDAIRAEIDRLELDRLERGAVLTSLLEAADRVDSTVGLQMAYLKQWAPRALRPLELREPEPVTGPAGTAVRGDANELAAALHGTDLAYVDPPYNQHSYFANYHVWETLTRNDRPGHYGVACKRADCRAPERRSSYNARREAGAALADLLARAQPAWLVVSLSNEGFHDLDEVAAMLAERGHVATAAIDTRRYVGATIGIHNPRGERVGTVSHLRATEALFVCGPDRRVTARVSALLRRLGAPPLRTGSAGSRIAGTTAAS